MRRSFSLPIKPFSVNQMYGLERNRKTADCLDWEEQFLHLLAAPGPQQALSDLRDAFQVGKHAYSVRFVCYYPESSFFTKEGVLSGRVFDLSNVEKPLLDLLCLPKNHYSAYGIGKGNLNIDDKHVVQLVSLKRPGKTHAIHVTIKIVPIPVAKVAG